MIRCLITDGTFTIRPRAWMELLDFWLTSGIEIIQIREKDLTPRELAELTTQTLALRAGRGTKVLVNDRADIALARGADGVHLRDGSIEPQKLRRENFIVSMTCHNIEDADRLVGADFALLGPIFNPLSKKAEGPALGTAAIREFGRRSTVPVLALAGITQQNARACLEAGAAGIAGITYFAR